MQSSEYLYYRRLLTVVITLLPAQSLVSRTDQWLFNKLLRHTSHATLSCDDGD